LETRFQNKHQVENLRGLTAESLPIKSTFSLSFFKINSQTIKSLASNSSDISYCLYFSLVSLAFLFLLSVQVKCSVTGAGTNSRQIKHLGHL